MSATWEGTSGSHLSSLSYHQAVAEEDMVSPSRSSNRYDPWYVKVAFGIFLCVLVGLLGVLYALPHFILER